MGWLSFLDFLVEPGFIDRSAPPLGLRISAKVMGWIALVLTVVLLLALLGVGIGSMTQIGKPGHAGIFAVALIGFVLLAGSHVVMLVGAWQMIQGAHGGRRVLLQWLILSVVFSLIYNIGLANVAQFLVQLLVRAVLYFFVVISRFPDENSPRTQAG